jgi:hypothetical protein
VKDVHRFRALENCKAQAVAHYCSMGKWAQVEVNDKGVDPAPRNVSGSVDTFRSS